MPPDAPSFDVARVRPPGQSRLPIVALAMAVALGVGVALAISERARDPGSAVASPSVPARVSASASPTLDAAASRPPRLVVLGEPVHIEPLLVHAAGPRMLDLEHGTIGPQLSTHPLDEWFQTGSGELLCLCRSVTRRDGVDSVDLRVVRGDPHGRARDAYLLLTTESVPPTPAPAVPGSGTTAHAALAPDGRTLLVAVADHTADGWRARVLIADANGERAPVEVALATALPGARNASAVDMTWNGLAEVGDAVRGIATAWVGIDDRQPRAFAALSVTPDAVLVETWPAEPTPAPEECTSSYGPAPVAGNPVQLCVGGRGAAITVRRVAVGELTSAASIAYWQAGGQSGEWRHVDDEQLVHWDPTHRQLAVIDPTAGVLLATRDEAPSLGESSTDGLRGPTVAIDAAGGTVTTLASADPVWVNSDPVRSPHIRGAPPRIVARYSLVTAERLAHWEAPSTATSLALSPDGRYVLVAVAPTDAEPYPNPFAGVIAYAADTGEVALVANRLGTVPVVFPPRSPAGVFAPE